MVGWLAMSHFKGEITRPGGLEQWSNTEIPHITKKIKITDTNHFWEGGFYNFVTNVIFYSWLTVSWTSQFLLQLISHVSKNFYAKLYIGIISDTIGNSCFLAYARCAHMNLS